jgi:hypothetical protein
MKNRTTSLINAIKKFNRLTQELSQQKDPTCVIPFPNPLSTDLAELRDDPELFQDVYVTPNDQFNGSLPEWLLNPNVRIGSRAAQMLKRCDEERNRIFGEAENMLEWFGTELNAIEMAILLSKGMIY